MKITRIIPHVLSYRMDEPLGSSQKYFTERSSFLVEVETDQGIVGIGEGSGGGGMAHVAASYLENVIAPQLIGRTPFDYEVLWHEIHSGTRILGRSGICMAAYSAVDIALWDLMGKATDRPLHSLLGGQFRPDVPAYGYGMMLRCCDDLSKRFAEEAQTIVADGFQTLKMKIGLGPKRDIELVEAVRDAVGSGVDVAVDANHCYTVNEAAFVGRSLGELGIKWFEEPVAPDDLVGYRRLRDTLNVPIAGGESLFTRWEMQGLLAGDCVDILQPEICSLGGITEYSKVLSLSHAHYVPVVNHCWGTAVTVAANLHLLTTIPPLPGSLYPAEPMLEFDTTSNRFRDHLLAEPLDVAGQVAKFGRVAPPAGPGLGITIDRDFLNEYKVN
ncbi:mandelate racemase/muconate lactonizing enzyme family protein [Halovulum sp. GXIMD14794]